MTAALMETLCNELLLHLVDLIYLFSFYLFQNSNLADLLVDMGPVMHDSVIGISS